MEIILKSVSLGNGPALTDDELTMRGVDWCEALEACVPEDRLRDAYLRAFKDHASGFPLSAYEVKIAWERVREEEAAAAVAGGGSGSGDAVEARDCQRCHGGGIELLFDVDGKVVGAKPGKACDHRAVVDGELFRSAGAASNVVSIGDVVNQMADGMAFKW